MNTDSINVGIFVFQDGTMPVKGAGPDGQPDEDNVGFDVTTRGIVSLRNCVPDERPHRRELIFDFDHFTERRLTDSTPFAGLSWMQSYGPQKYTVKFTPNAMIYFGCGFVLDMPRGMHALIVARGSTTARGFDIKNDASPIEWTFGGEPVMAVSNFTKEFLELGKSDLTLGQLIFPGFPNVQLIPVNSIDDIPPKRRGNGNHGSTDKNRKK